MKARLMRRSAIVDQQGRPFLMAAAPSYENAGGGRRFRGFDGTTLSASSALYGALELLRARSRQAYQRNPWAVNGVESYVANCVGTGVRPRARLLDAAARAELHALFDDWCDDADAHERTTFYGLQQLAMRATVLDGECFIRFRTRRPEDELEVPLQLQLLEGDHVPVWKHETIPGGNRVRAGIEFNAIGKRVAYWMYREHPGELVPLGIGANAELVRVPAEDVVHLYQALRPGQIRGVPWLATVLLRLHEIDQYEDAELVRKKVAAMFALFVTRPDEGTATPLGAVSEVDEQGYAELDVEPGSTTILRPGEHVENAAPADVGQSFDVFLKHNLRAIAAGIGVTYEQLTGDLREVNYSSIRAGLLEFRRRCEMLIHATLVFGLCRPTWRRFLEMAALAGVIDVRDYARNRRQYERVKWMPQGWQWVDPAKEVAAHKEAVLAGFESRPGVCAERGEDVETIDEENALANRAADALGLRYTSDGRTVTGAAASAGAPSPRPATPPDPEEALDEPDDEAPRRRRQAAGGAA